MKEGSCSWRFCIEVEMSKVVLSPKSVEGTVVSNSTSTRHSITEEQPALPCCLVFAFSRVKRSQWGDRTEILINSKHFCSSEFESAAFTGRW